MTGPTNFLGIPISGDINHDTERRVPQRPLEELTPIMQAVLDDDNVEKFGWRQYTPYFNDGDPCIFHARSVWAVPSLVAVFENGYESDGEIDTDGVEYDKRWGHRPYDWAGEPGSRVRVPRPYEGPCEATYDRLIALNNAVEGGAFDNVLLEHFGDHANITITRSGIEVEEYSHD